METGELVKLNVHVGAKWRMTDEGWVVDVVIRHLDRLPKTERIPLSPDGAATLAAELTTQPVPADSNGHP